jgi:hypothetical protein
MSRQQVNPEVPRQLPTSVALMPLQVYASNAAKRILSKASKRCSSKHPRIQQATCGISTKPGQREA